MGTVIVPTDIGNRFLSAGGTADIRDESGQLIGRFTAEPELGISVEELNRRAADTRSGVSTADVLNHVRKLA